MYPFRRAKDRELKPEQRTSAMLQRVTKADYVYPPGLQLSAGEGRASSDHAGAEH